MADPGQLALIHAEIDGELDAAQRAELARALLADPKARELRDDLRRICQTLDAVPPVEPPPGLQESILAAMPQRVPRLGRTGLARSRMLASRSAIAAWRYAAMLAGVLVAGAVLFELARNPAPEPRELAGTIAPDPAATLVDTAQVTNQVTNQAARVAVSGHVSLYRDRAALTLRFEITANTPVDARVTSEGHTVQIVGVSHAAAPGTGTLGTPVAAALPDVAMHGQAIEVALISGGHRIGAATLRAPGGP